MFRLPGSSQRILILTLLLLSSTALQLHAAPVFLTLPDSGSYSYWIQSSTGSVSIMPHLVHGQAKVALPAAASAGTLYVLDAHDGEIAAAPLIGQPITLTDSDFKAQLSPAPAPAVSSNPAMAPSPAPKAPAAASGNGIERFFTLIFGLIVAAGVIWVVWKIVTSRGQPLIEAARRLGVEVPDPSAPITEDQAAPAYTPPAPKIVQKIPEAAGVAPQIPVHASPRSSSGTFNEPQLVGIQGIAAGSTFAIPVGEVTFGREGDNDIVLADSTVSRLHARLTRTNDGRITLTDAGSSNGISVNERHVAEAILSAGDQIQIGDNLFRLEA